MSNGLTPTYTTIQGDMFDWISYKIYGTSIYSPAIIRLNSSWNDTTVFDAGIQLTLPSIPAGQNNVSNVPWGTLFN